MKKVLLVEDDRAVVDMYHTKLRVEGFDVAVALNGEDGLRLALSTHPDLILLDLALPKMDGMTLMQQLRKDLWGSQVPVIILTNLDTDDKILQGVIKYQPSYYLMKVETTPEEVVEQIKKVLKLEEN